MAGKNYRAFSGFGEELSYNYKAFLYGKPLKLYFYAVRPNSWDVVSNNQKSYSNDWNAPSDYRESYSNDWNAPSSYWKSYSNDWNAPSSYWKSYSNDWNASSNNYKLTFKTK